MLQHEKRNIAAYYGTPYTCERFYTMGSIAFNNLLHEGKIPEDCKGDIWLPKTGLVSSSLLSEIGFGFMIRNLKLQLCSLRCLTKDYLLDLRRVIGLSECSFTSRASIDLRKDTIRLDDLIIEFETGKIWAYYGDTPLPTAAAYAYLQSKHFYIPGVIDPQYFELVSDPFHIFLT